MNFDNKLMLFLHSSFVVELVIRADSNCEFLNLIVGFGVGKDAGLLRVLLPVVE